MLALRVVLAVLMLPACVTILVPWAILSSWSFVPVAPPAWGPPQITGALVIAAGLALVVATVRQFATTGRGTLAPWDPPRRLVVAGLYRHVRNPMITGVCTVLLGESLLFRSAGLLAWAATFFALNAIVIPLAEEPMLERRFGDDYREYRKHVPRWLPRLTPWTPPDAAGE